MLIRSATAADAPGLAAIYNQYILHTTVTFEEVPVTAAEMAARLAAIQATHPWLVACDLDRVVGYAYAGPWKARSAYRHSAEVTVYLDHTATGRGIGSALYERLLAKLTALGTHAIMGGIALPNPASVALHEKFGFHRVAHFREVGFKFNQWIDVGYWELLLPGESEGSDKR